MYDVIIIGGGPAGLSAAIYAARACLKTLLLEKQPMGGGQILNTAEVDNYLGLPGTNGFELGQRFSEHAKRLGVCPVTEEVIRIDCKGEVKKVVTKKREYETKAVIYAAGADHRKLHIPGEEEFAGGGVSYCATCDGAFFRGKTTAVIGGGDVALEDALFLSNVCQKVFLIHRRDAFRGAKTLVRRVEAAANIELLMDTAAEEIKGDGTVKELVCADKKTGEKKSLSVDGVFIAVGMTPHTSLLAGQVKLDEAGYIVAGEDCKTSVKGVFAAGDVRTKKVRQIATAVSDGAAAVAEL